MGFKLQRLPRSTSRHADVNADKKTSLTPYEEITAAYYYWVKGIDQDDIKGLIGVSNVGRVNESVKKIGAVVKLCAPSYKNNGD